MVVPEPSIRHPSKRRSRPRTSARAPATGTRSRRRHTARYPLNGNTVSTRRASEPTFKTIQKETKSNAGVEKMLYFGTPTEAVLTRLVNMFQQIATRRCALRSHAWKADLTTLIDNHTNGIMVGVAEWQGGSANAPPTLSICFSGYYRTSRDVWQAKRRILNHCLSRGRKTGYTTHLFNTHDDYTCRPGQLLYPPFLRYKSSSGGPKAENGSTCVEPKMYHYLCQKNARPTGLACVFLPIELFVSDVDKSQVGQPTIDKYNLQPEQRASFVERFIRSFPKLKAKKQTLATIVANMAYPCPGCQMNHDAIVQCVPPTYTRLPST